MQVESLFKELCEALPSSFMMRNLDKAAEGSPDKAAQPDLTPEQQEVWMKHTDALLAWLHYCTQAYSLLFACRKVYILANRASCTGVPAKAPSFL